MGFPLVCCMMMWIGSMSMFVVEEDAPDVDVEELAKF